MEFDTDVLIVNSLLATGIVLALVFGVILGRMNKRLEKQNREARKKLDQEG